MNFDTYLDAKDNRRQVTEAKFHDRISKREEIAELQIGELSDGKYYVFPVGGKYKESTSRVDLISYLIRNKYA